jgi:hypothetical protein
MSNAFYPLWKRALMQEGQNNEGLDQSDVNNAPYVALIAAGAYSFSTAHQFYSDLTGVQGTDQQITNPGVSSLAIFSGQDVVFVNVTAPSIGALAFYRKNAGANTTWRLVLFEDTGVVGFPIAPNGGNLIVTWNAQGIFQL